MAAFKLKALAAGVLLACGLGLDVGPGWVANGQDIPTKPLPSKEQADKANQLLEQQLAEEEAKRRSGELLKWSPLDDEILDWPWPISDDKQRAFDEAKRRMAESEKGLGIMPEFMRRAYDEAQRGLEKSRPEFLYVPLPDGHIGAADFEKLVTANDTGGYTFVGCVPMKGSGPQQGVTQTLVFRKKPAPAIAAKPPASKAKWVEIDLGPPGPKGHDQLFKAICTLGGRKYGGKPNAMQMLFDGSRKMQFWGDPEAVRWVTELVENLKK